MTDEELLQVARERDSLREDAKDALALELNRRGLEQEPIALPPSEPELLRTGEKWHRAVFHWLLRVWQAMNQSPMPDERYCGVQGWLQVFVLYLTIVYPLGMALTLPQWRASRYGGAPIFPWAPWALFAERSFVIMLAALGFYAGLSLWRIWPNAVRLSKFYAILVVGNGVAVSVFVWFIERQTGLAHRLSMSIKPISAVVLGAICYVYLSKSKRVASTYKS